MTFTNHHIGWAAEKFFPHLPPGYGAALVREVVEIHVRLRSEASSVEEYRAKVQARLPLIAIDEHHRFVELRLRGDPPDALRDIDLTITGVILRDGAKPHPGQRRGIR